MSGGNNADAIARFFTAIERQDRATIEQLYAPDIEVWHSHTGQTLRRDAALAVLDGLRVPGVRARYELLEQFTAGERTARRHRLHIVIGASAPIIIPASIFLTIRDGRITRIDEYLDRRLVIKLAARILHHVGVGAALSKILALRRASRGKR